MGAARGTTVRGSHPLFCTILAILFLGERPSFWVILADRMADARKLDDWTVFVIVDGGGVIAQFIPRQRAVQYLRLGQRGAARRQALVVRQTALGNANFAWVQHIIYHLAPTGIAGFVLANGSMSSN